MGMPGCGCIVAFACIVGSICGDAANPPGLAEFDRADRATQGHPLSGRRLRGNQPSISIGQARVPVHFRPSRNNAFPFGNLLVTFCFPIWSEARGDNGR